MKGKVKRKTRADLGKRQELPDNPESLASAVEAIFADMHADAIRELLGHQLLVPEGGGRPVDEPAIFLRARPAVRKFSQLVQSSADAEGWPASFKMPCNDGTVCHIDKDRWQKLTDGEKGAISELLDGLVLSARLANAGSDEAVVGRLLLPVMPDTAVPDVYVDELNRILPEKLKKSDLFMSIIQEISGQMRETGLLKEIEQQITAEMAPRHGGASEPSESRLAELHDDGLPALESLPDDLRAKIEAATRTKDADDSKRVNPEFMMKLTQSLLGSPDTEAGGNNIATSLKGIAEKISSNLKSQVELRSLSADAIRSDLTEALSFLSSMGMGGVPKFEPVD